MAASEELIWALQGSVTTDSDDPPLFWLDRFITSTRRYDGCAAFSRVLSPRIGFTDPENTRNQPNLAYSHSRLICHKLTQGLGHDIMLICMKGLVWEGGVQE